MTKPVRECCVCGRVTLDLVTISEDAEFYQDEGLVKPHHVIQKVKYPDGDSCMYVQAPVCTDCMGRVFAHMEERQPEGALRHYCVRNGRGEEKRKLKALSIFSGMLADGTCDHEDLMDLVRCITGEDMKFNVTIQVGR